ncbi:MAG: hypothetical protein ACO3JF_02345 [Ilumatobacteraceae bacterium]
MTTAESFPPPPPQNTSHKPIGRKIGCLVSIAGVLLAFSPLLILAAALPFADLDGMNEANSSLAVLPWLLYFSLPFGLIIVLVGLIIWLVAMRAKK